MLGGHGNSGSYLFDDFGQPRIDDYANNDGWFDDTSDGTVMARLIMFSTLVQRMRYVDVEYPAWVVAAYPAYVPVILDLVTMDDVIEDMAIRKFAGRTDLYGTSGTFEDPPHIPPTDEQALIHWRAGRLRWNPDYRPWFYRDIWSILYRPDQFSYLCDALGQSNYPHNQSTRGSFDPEKLGHPPVIDRQAVAACEKKCVRDHHSGHLFVETLGAALAPIETNVRRTRAGAGEKRLMSRKSPASCARRWRGFTHELMGDNPGHDIDDYLSRWLAAAEAESSTQAKEKLKRAVEQIVSGLSHPD